MNSNIYQRSDDLNSRLMAAARVLQRTDRILSGKFDLTVEYDPQAHLVAPAYSDADTITLSSKITTSGEIDTLKMLGLNYHELCHVMFTPSDTSVAVNRLHQEGIPYDLFNQAEDQRIEMLFSKMYSPAVPFFRQAVADLILDGAQHVSETWPLIAGRLYIPANIRKAAKAAYAEAHSAVEAQAIEDLLREYLLIDWDTDIDEGIDILKALLDIYQDDAPQAPCASQSGGADQDHPDAEDARDQVAEDAANDDTSDEPEDQDEDQDAEEGDSETSAEEGDSDEDQDESEEVTGGPGEPGEEDEAQEEGEDGDEATEGQGEASPEPGDAEGEGEGAPEAADAEGDAQEATEGDASDGRSPGEVLLDETEAMQDEAESEMEKQGVSMARDIELELDRPGQELGANFPKNQGFQPVTSEAQALAHDLYSTLAELAMAVEPGWHRDRNRGRINPGRFLRSEPWDIEGVFDEWDEGLEDALDIEVAIMVDTSSSMLNGKRNGKPIQPSHEVAAAAWALKKALDDHGIPAGVLTFDSQTRRWFKPSDQADPAWMPASLAVASTNPVQGLAEVGRVFAESRHKRRIFICLTDGAWFEGLFRVNGTSVSKRQMVENIDAEVRVLLQFGGSPQTQLGFDEVRTVDEGAALVEAVRDTIVEGVRKLDQGGSRW